jgi:hypothetical protein
VHRLGILNGPLFFLNSEIGIKWAQINSNPVSDIGTHIALAAFSFAKKLPLLQINYFGWDIRSEIFQSELS